MVLRDACQNSLFNDLFQIRVFKLHDKKYVGQLVDLSFFWRHNYIVQFRNEAAFAVGRYFMEFSHYLDLSDKLDAIIVVMIEPLYMFDGYNFTSLEACSFVHLTVATLSNFFHNLVLLQYFSPCATKTKLVHRFKRQRLLDQELLF